MAKRNDVFNITNGKCYYCGCQLEFDSFHMDHILPKSQGGKNKNNLVPTCVDCNLSKGNLDIEEFRAKLQRMTTATHIGRMISKYHNINDSEIVFYFEEKRHGNL